MVRRLVLHIGYYKTGSTALQDQLTQLSAPLRDRGVLYPEAGRPVAGYSSHSGLAFQELHGAESHLPLWYRESPEFLSYQSGDAPTARESLTREISESPADTVVISSEEFVRFGSRQGVPIEQARAMIQSLGLDRVTVICYLRRPDRYLESWYNQVVKMGLPIPRLSVSMKREPHPDHRYYCTEHTDFDRMIEYWATHVGCDELLLRDYDDLYNGTVLDDFCHAAGLPPLNGVEIPEIHTNPRIDNNFIEYARVWALFRPREPNKELLDVLERMETQAHIPQRGPVHVLDAGARRRLHRYVEPINERLGKLAGRQNGYFTDLDELLEVPSGSISDLEAFRFWAPYIEVAARAMSVA